MRRKEEMIAGQLDFKNLLKARSLKDRLELEKKAYNQWLTDIVQGLVDIGFKSSDARDMASNYTGMYYSQFHRPEPDEIIRMIMKKGRNIYVLPDDKLREYEKKTGEKLPLDFSPTAR